MSFLLSCPEVNSAQMYTGAGSAPMLAAAAAWDGLSAELDSAAESFKSLISGLTASWWQGQAAGKMIEVALPYAQWLGGAATQAGGAATGAKAVAALFEQARAAVVHPLAVELNRNQVVSLAIHNIFGLNAPAIAAKEIEYEEMWAADVDAMLSYHGGASTVAQQLAPWQSALKGLTGQIAPAIGAPLPPAPAATLIEYSLLTALISITAATAIPGVSRFGVTVGAVITPVAKAATTAATAVVASTNAAVAPVAKAIASTPLVAAANAALAPAVSQVSLAVSGVALNAGQVANAVAQEAGKTIGLVQSAALTAQLTGLAGDPALLSGFVSGAIGNPALLNSFLPVLASNPALVTGIFGVLASNPQLVLSLVTQVQNNPALAAQLFGAFAQLQAANPALAAQLVDLATQLGRQLGIGQAA